MKLRFEVDQAEAFRRGIDAPKSIVTIEVTPAEIPEDIRKEIADRMDGIDVCSMDGSLNRLKTAEPTFESLVEAVKADKPVARSTEFSKHWADIQNRREAAV